jgi:phosphoserine phosphatase RsbU/P
MSLLYMCLAAVNMSFFTIMIYENQIDLITENSKYHIRERTEDFIASLKKLSSEMGDKRIFHLENRDEVIKEFASMILTKITSNDSLVIFNETGTILFKSKPSIEISKNDIANGITAITNLDYSGRQVYSTIDEKNFVISFYIPYKLYLLGDSIILLKIEIREFQSRLRDLYIMIMVILGFLAIFHVAFAILFQRLFLRPIQTLHEKSLEISHGNLEARADLKRDDEIGELATAFNTMADSIQEKIITLQHHHDQNQLEMRVASGVQQLIYPQIQSNQQFNYTLYHKSFALVSGDYYDIIKLGDSKTGFILVDVSGHGVPAALVTMVIKEIFNRAAPLYDNPADLFRYMNNEIIALLAKEDTLGIYLTAIYLMINENNVLSFCSAGHEEAYILKSDIQKIASLNASGGPLGISPDMNSMYTTVKAKLDAGDKILLFTDGIVEAQNLEGVRYGTDQLLSSIKKVYTSSGDIILMTIIDDIQSFLVSGTFKDDATLILIEMK